MNEKDHVLTISLANYLDHGRIPAQVLEARGSRASLATESARNDTFNFVDSTVQKSSQKSEVSTGPKVLVRLEIRSPWIDILLIQLAGTSNGGVLVRPFKPLIAYERQIRKYAELLDQTNVTITSNKDLVATLKNIWREAFATKNYGLDIDELDDNDLFVQLRGDDFLRGHFQKIDDTVLRNEDPANEISDDSENTGKSGEVLVSTGLDREAQKLSSMSDKTSRDEKAVKDTNEGVPRDRICTCLQNAKEHIQLLVQFMDEYLSDLITIRRDIVSGKQGKIAFQDLWLLYQPRDIVVSSRSDRQAYRVLQVSGGRPLMTQSLDFGENQPPYVGAVDQDSPDINNRTRNSPFIISLVKLEFDGQNLGPVQHQVVVRDFDDEIAISKLEVYPLNLAKGKIQVKKDLVESGKLFVTLAKIAHMRHSGLSFGEP